MAILWTDAEKSLLISLHEKGVFFKDMVSEFPNRNIKQLYNQAYRLGLWRVEEKNWTKSEEEKAILLKLGGHSIGKIAKELDRTKKSVVVKLSRLRKKI